MFDKNFMKIKSVLFISIFFTGISVVHAQTKITINTNSNAAPISKTMYGIFFEDINFGADGGLYSELVKNRGFEFPESAVMGWTRLAPGESRGSLSIRTEEPFEKANPHYMHIEVRDPGSNGFGINNEGFRGMGLRKGETYLFSIYANAPMEVMSFKIELISSDGKVIGQAAIDNVTKGWKHYSAEIVPTETDAKATFNLLGTKVGLLDVDMVSLFPKESAVKLMGRDVPGLRIDLVQMLADMKPGFLRFPGGCIVEGRDLGNRYQWKNTIGDINQRQTIIGRWNTEFGHRLTPDYYQSFGLGFFEYFMLCEQIGAEPMPIINCGMACQFNTCELVPMDELGPYVQDAIDLIEFANAPANSKWGKIRADMGHPESFNMKMIGIGNEQWGSQYIERYKFFAEAIKDGYPYIQLIAATGSDATIFPNGQAEIEYLWSQWRELRPEYVDEHFYRRPEWFIENTGFYDEYDRKGPKLFVGEYAAQSGGVANPDNRNNWKCALYEAAFITGMERNADLVRMTCYAPLFGHEEAWQWRPDMIWFDNLNVYGSANYYVQKLFSLNPGTNLLKAHVNDAPNLNDKTKALSVSSTFDNEKDEVIIKVTNVSAKAIKTNIELQGITKAGPQMEVITLNSSSLTNENSIKDPKNIYPAENTIALSSPSFSFDFAPYSFTILRVPVEK
ncbi:MAG: hypothetical protein JXA96_10410 [Sedimentisphaerales bacterium]|nr:hypothetical protein [Sedimentisphaerales bacterium]